MPEGRGLSFAIQGRRKGRVKIHIFHLHYFNIDIALINEDLCLKISVPIDDIHLEVRVSHFFCIGLSFCFMTCRNLMFVKNEKSQRLPVFGHKIKTMPSY